MIEMSREKLFHTGNTHTSFSLSKYDVCVAIFRSRSVEMGAKRIEMSQIYDKVYSKIV